MSLTLLILVILASSYPANSILHRGNFPNKFIFGTSSSAAQYEGAAKEEGRGPSIWDNFSHTPGKIIDGSNPDVAVDQYHRYQEDVNLMVDLGVDAYRFSISWSRIFPSGKGQINKQGVDYYNRLINELLSKGIQPLVTLNHFDVPQALEEEYGSWLSPKIVEHFVAFAETCFQEFGDRVKQWITINEPHISTNYAYNLGILAPGRCSSEVGMLNCTSGNSSTEPYLVAHHYLLAHAAAVQSYRSKFKAKQNGTISISLDAMWFEPYSNAPKDALATERAREFNLAWMMDPIIFGDYPLTLRSLVGERLPKFTKQQQDMLRGSWDFVGINHYSSLYVADSRNRNFGAPPLPDFNQQAYFKDASMHVTDTRRNGRVIGRNINGVRVYPKGFRKLLNYIRLRYNNPTIIITENGISDVANGPLEQVLNDNVRINYLKRYLWNLALAIKDGCDVRGYFVWSLMDNWEWATGFSVKYGLYHVDNTNLTRTPKNSALWYKNMLKN